MMCSWGTVSHVSESSFIKIRVANAASDRSILQTELQPLIQSPLDLV